MELKNVVRYDCDNKSCFICQERFEDKYFEIKTWNSAISFLVCSTQCEAEVWRIMAGV